MRRKTSKLIRDLRKLADEAVSNLYQRIGIAAEVLTDLDWIAKDHEGSDLKARKHLQDAYFRDIGGFISLGKLISIYEAIDAEQWASVDYDVAAVEVLYDKSHKVREKGTRTSWKKIAEERAELIERLQLQIDELTKSNLHLRKENDSLRAQLLSEAA